MTLGTCSGSGHSGSPITIGGAALGSNFRQIVSSSAPTSSIDMDAMLMQSSQEGAATPGTGDDYYRDRRKKDIHNMSKFAFLCEHVVCTMLEVLF